MNVHTAHRLRPIAAALAVVAVATALPATAKAKAKADPLRSYQWSLDTVRAPEAWRYSTGRGVTVALLDSGADLTHPELVGNLLVLPGSDFVDPDGCDENDCADDGPKDTNGHGTATASMVGAAANNGVGISGVAPNARLMPVRVVPPSGVDYVAMAAGIRFAADNGADVIGVWQAFPELPYVLSSQGVTGGESANAQPPGAVQALYDAVEHAWGLGALVVASAGNGWPGANAASDDLPPNAAGKPECGAPAVHPLVLCVGAVDREDQHVYYSDFRALDPEMLLVGPSGNEVSGGVLPEELAPCADRVVVIALAGTTRRCPGALPTGYTYISGTTAATAHVVGVAALLAAQGRSNRQILDVLRKSAVDLGPPGPDPVYGFGRVDALAAVRTPV
jgi:subtilisin family serine protease